MPKSDLFLWTSRQLDRTGRAVLYAAAGAMPLAELRANMARAYDVYAAPPDVAQGLMPWEQELNERYVRAGDRVLVVGCGSGRDVFPLVAFGCRVTGVEPSAPARERFSAELARRAASVPVVAGFFEDAMLPGPFDVVNFSCHCYSLIPGRGRRVAALRKAAGLLAPGGRILLSVGGPLPPPHPWFIRVARASAALWGTDWRVEDGDVVCRTEGDAIHFQHAFGPAELETEVRAAGLEVIFQSRLEVAVVAAAPGP